MSRRILFSCRGVSLVAELSRAVKSAPGCDVAEVAVGVMVIPDFYLKNGVEVC